MSLFIWSKWRVVGVVVLNIGQELPLASKLRSEVRYFGVYFNVALGFGGPLHDV